MKAACDRTDLPIAGLLQDPATRLAEDTLQSGAVAFGRFPSWLHPTKMSADATQQERRVRWLASGGIKGSTTYGQPTNSDWRREIVSIRLARHALPRGAASRPAFVDHHGLKEKRPVSMKLSHQKNSVVKELTVKRTANRHGGRDRSRAAPRFLYCTDPQAGVREIVEVFADRGEIEQVFHGVKKIRGSGQQQANP
jgi:hypothetical protein